MHIALLWRYCGSACVLVPFVLLTVRSFYSPCEFLRVNSMLCCLNSSLSCCFNPSMSRNRISSSSFRQLLSARLRSRAAMNGSQQSCLGSHNRSDFLPLGGIEVSSFHPQGP